MSTDVQLFPTTEREIRRRLAYDDIVDERTSTGLGNLRKFSCEQVAEALVRAGGSLSGAARVLGCCRKTMHDYVRDYFPDRLRQVLAEARETTLDVAESKLLSAVERGEPWAVKFLLATQGKSRGYTFRVENTGKDGGPQEFKDVSPREVLERKLRAMVARVDAADAEFAEEDEAA